MKSSLPTQEPTLKHQLKTCVRSWARGKENFGRPIIDIQEHIISILQSDQSITEDERSMLMMEAQSVYEQMSQTRPATFTSFSQALVRIWNELLPDTQTNGPTHCVQVPNVDDICQRINVPPLKEGDAYVGGVARRIFREILEYDIPREDSDLSDRDVLVWSHMSEIEAAHYYDTVPEGLKKDYDGSSKAIDAYLARCDLDINQIVVTNTHVYFGSTTNHALKTRVVMPTAMGRDFFSNNSYEKDGETIFNKSTIERIFKFLVEGKALKANISAHNLAKDNLDLVKFDIQMLVLMRRIMRKNIDDDRKLEICTRFADLLIQMGYIDAFENLFVWAEERMDARGFEMSSASSHQPPRGQFLWKLEKYISIAVDQVLDSSEAFLEHYHLDHKETRELSVSECVSVSEKFREEFYRYRRLHFSEKIN